MEHAPYRIDSSPFASSTEREAIAYLKIAAAS
jgi:hypothetical protein